MHHMQDDVNRKMHVMHEDYLHGRLMHAMLRHGQTYWDRRGPVAQTTRRVDANARQQFICQPEREACRGLHGPET